MNFVIYESLLVGFIVAVIGNISFNLIINEKKDSKTNKPKGINLAFFVTGFVLHIILEYIGLNKWYCQRQCTTGLKRFIPINLKKNID